MIGLSIFILGLLFAGFTAYKTKNQMTGGKWNEFQLKWLLKPIGILLLSIIIALVQPFTIERVDTGYKGLKINLTGGQRGVSDYQYKTGWVMYNSWTEQVKEFPLYQQHIEYDEQTTEYATMFLKDFAFTDDEEDDDEDDDDGDLV